MYIVPGEFKAQLDNVNFNSGVGAHKFVVLPGLTRPPAGFDSFFIIYFFVVEQPLFPIAVIDIVNAPRVV